jgi:hypothetical protein
MTKSVYAVVGTVLCTLIMTNEIVLAQSKDRKQPPPEQRPASEDGDPGAENRGLGVAGVAGLPDCPERETEVFFLTYAREDTETECATVVSCTNLDSVPRTVTCLKSGHIY